MHPSHQTDGRTENTTPQVIEVELLALDLTGCTRCVATLENIEKAIAVVRPVLEATGARVSVSKLVVESEEQARRCRFVSSPTVRVNGRDIAFELLESACQSCTDLCGCNEGTNCRVWRYRGEEYPEAPVGLVVEAMLRELFETSNQSRCPTTDDCGVPENLRRFFRGRSAARSEASSCCPPAEQETCCDPNQKGECCHDSEPTSCGCR